MTTSRARAAEVILRANHDWRQRHPALDPITSQAAHHYAQHLEDAGLLASDEYRTAYGVRSRSPDGTEDYLWCRDESLGTARGIYYSMQGAGWEAEIIARHVSEPRFVTIAKEPNHDQYPIWDTCNHFRTDALDSPRVALSKAGNVWKMTPEEARELAAAILAAANHAEKAAAHVGETLGDTNG